MTEPCSCDESKAWKAQAEASNLRATEAELSLSSVRVQLRRLLEHIDRVLDGIPGEDVVNADGELIGRTAGEIGIGARAVDWVIPCSESKTLDEAAAAWMAAQMPKSERP